MGIQTEDLGLHKKVQLDESLTLTGEQLSPLITETIKDYEQAYIQLTKDAAENSRTIGGSDKYLVRRAELIIAMVNELARLLESEGSTVAIRALEMLKGFEKEAKKALDIFSNTGGSFVLQHLLHETDSLRAVPQDGFRKFIISTLGPESSSNSDIDIYVCA